MSQTSRELYRKTMLAALNQLIDDLKVKQFDPESAIIAKNYYGFAFISATDKYREGIFTRKDVDDVVQRFKTIRDYLLKKHGVAL